MRPSISTASIPAPSAISPSNFEMVPRPGIAMAFSAGKESTKSHRNAKAKRPAAVRFPLVLRSQPPPSGSGLPFAPDLAVAGLRTGFQLRRREGERTVSSGQPQKQDGQSRQLLSLIHISEPTRPY